MTNYGPGPHVAVDMVVDVVVLGDSTADWDKFSLLIRRPDGRIALPGGFVDPVLDASLERAAFRETREETGLDLYRYAENSVSVSLPIRTDRCRDPRSWVISHPFYVELVLQSLPIVSGQDDAKEAFWLSHKDIEKIAADEWFLDHYSIWQSIEEGTRLEW